MSIRSRIEELTEAEWSTVVDFAKAIDEKHGAVTAFDLVSGLSISNETAQAFMDKLIDIEGWEVILTRKR